MQKNMLHSKLALGTIASVFMLIIMIAAMTSLIALFMNANSTLQKQMSLEQEQSKEQISITQIGVDGTGITNVTIRNTGAIDVTIRAIYRNIDGVTNFLIDPDTPIAESYSQTLDISSLNLTMQPHSTFSASTERGVKSKSVNEIELNFRDYISTTNSSALSIGPLLLTFDSLNWARCDSGGNVIGDWIQTWTIPTGTCSWRLNFTNIDEDKRDLIISKYSGFTLSRVGSPSTTTWYLKNLEETIGWNTTKTIVYVWKDNRAEAQSAGSNQKGLNNVFLTFFGNYSDGKSLAQTIPFQAIIVT